MKIRVSLEKQNEIKEYHIDKNKVRVAKALAAKEIRTLKNISVKNKTPGLFYLIIVFLNKYTSEILDRLDNDLLKALLEQDVIPKDEYDLRKNKEA